MTLRMGLWQSLVCVAGMVLLGVMAVLALAQQGGAVASVPAAVVDGWHTHTPVVEGVGVVLPAPSVPVVSAAVPTVAAAAPTVAMVASVVPVEAGPLACWTEPKPAAAGGPERICGDVRLAPVDAVGFGPWPVVAAASTRVAHVTHPARVTHAARVRAPRLARVRTVKTPKPVKAPKVRRVKAQPVAVPVVLVPAAAFG